MPGNLRLDFRTWLVEEQEDEAMVASLPDITARFKLGRKLGQGNSATVFEALSPNGGETGLAIYFFPPFMISRYLDEKDGQAVLAPHLPIPRIREVGKYDGRPCFVVDRAKGEDMHTRTVNQGRWRSRIGQLASAPQSHFSDYVRNAGEIARTHRIDPSNPDNLTYHPEHGIGFLDLAKGPYEGSLDRLLDLLAWFYPHRQIATAEDFGVMVEILKKLVAAGWNGKGVRQFIEKVRRYVKGDRWEAFKAHLTRAGMGDEAERAEAQVMQSNDAS